MKTNEKIPLFQIVYFVIIFLLILFRALFSSLELYINLANYISMAVAISCVFISVIRIIKNKRRRNICKALFCVLVSSFALLGFVILILNITIPPTFNDIFTLVALWFCLSDKVFKKIITSLISLGLK